MISFLGKLNGVADIVLIENQVAFSNQRMKSMQDIIFTFFTLKGSEVININPKNRVEFIAKTLNIEGKQSYPQRKKNAINTINKQM
jgi:hypothetical protein